MRLIIPTDVRPAVHAVNKPPPVSGGTLLVTRSGTHAVVSDPERDTILVADLASGSIAGTIALQPDDEPGRVVEDFSGRVHVALRRGGAVVTVDPVTRVVVDRRAVCGAPRGIALSGIDTLAVACADGKLVTLPAGPGGVIRTLHLEADLRDVVVHDGALSVTRFKAAEVLRLDTEGAIVRRDRPASVTGTRVVPIVDERHEQLDGTREVAQPFRPLVAWRTLAGPNGTTVIVHQRSVDGPIEITEPSVSGSSYGGGSGGGFTCGGISQNAVTVMGADGAVTNLTFAGAPLPVDATLLADGRTLVVAHAGPPDRDAPRPFVMFDDHGAEQGPGFQPEFPQAGTVSVLQISIDPPTTRPPEGTAAPDPGCVFSSALPVFDPAVAVASNPTRPAQLVVQTRQPSTLVIIDDINQPWSARTIFYDDGTTLDTGFQLFHRDSGGGIACATCHAEGSEDGHTWRFVGFGSRRTQSLDVGLEGTAPFHWDGALPNVGSLMSEVFVGRMGGVRESPSRLAGLENWLFDLAPPAPLRSADDPAVQRGKAVFESPRTGCSSCHSGKHFTNNRTLDVGTRASVPLQVPTLVGLAYRAPFMHDGCAPTLAARFDPECGGGERHGHTAELAPEELGDLIAYLESL